MSRVSCFFILSFCVIAAACTEPKAEISALGEYQVAIDSSKRIIEDFMMRENIPGLSITMMKKGEMIWSEGFGFADLEQEIIVYPNKTKFRIGSIAKPMTAAMLAQLYESGKLDLDVPVQTYVPSFPKKNMKLRPDN